MKAAQAPGESASRRAEAGLRMKAAVDISARAQPMKCVTGETGRGRRADVRSSGAVLGMETAAARAKAVEASGAKAVEASGGKAGGSGRGGMEGGRGVDAPRVRTGGEPGAARAKPAKA